MCIPRAPKMVPPPPPALAPTAPAETAERIELPTNNDPDRARRKRAGLGALRLSRPSTGVRAQGTGTNIPY